MSISNRLDELERRLGVGAACPDCGHGTGRITLLPMDPDGTPPAEPGPCPTCGRTPQVIRLRPIRLDGPRELEPID